MTAVLPRPVDPHGAATAVDQVTTILSIATQIGADCETHGVRVTGIAPTVSFGQASAVITVPMSDTTGVDLLADAYRLLPASLSDDAYDRRGIVNLGGETVLVTVLCARPAVLALPPVPAAGAIVVASERTDANVAAEQ